MLTEKCSLLVSDSYLFQEGVKSLLKLNGKCSEVVVAESPGEFEDLLQRFTPVLVLVDMESRIFRLEKVLAFVDFTTKSHVLLMGGKMPKKDCISWHERGAKGLVLKESSKKVLLAGVNEVLNGRDYIDENLCKDQSDNVSMLEKFKISIREKEIIEQIAQGLINKEIADKLFISIHTVNTHRKNIMSKLGINNTAGIVLFAVKEGIVSPDEFLFT